MLKVKISIIVLLFMSKMCYSQKRELREVAYDSLKVYNVFSGATIKYTKDSLVRKIELESLDEKIILIYDLKGRLKKTKVYRNKLGKFQIVVNNRYYYYYGLLKVKNKINLLRANIIYINVKELKKS